MTLVESHTRTRSFWTMPDRAYKTKTPENLIDFLLTGHYIK